MKKYIVMKGEKTVGGVEVSARVAEHLRKNGYTLLPA